MLWRQMMLYPEVGHNMSIDQRGAMEKVGAGDFSSLDLADATNIGQMASGPVMGKLLKSVPGMGIANTAMAGVAGFVGSDKDADILAEQFSKKNLRALMHQNPALRKKLRELDDRWQGSMVDASISTI